MITSGALAKTMIAVEPNIKIQKTGAGGWSLSSRSLPASDLGVRQSVDPPRGYVHGRTEST